MKLKKNLLIGIIVAIICVLQFTNIVYAAGEDTVAKTFEVNIASTNSGVNLQNLKPGTEFELKFSMTNLQNVEKGIVAMLAQLEYNKDVLDRIEIIGLGQWTLDEDDFNENNLKFIIENGSLINTPGDILKIKFRVKSTITEEQTTIVKLKGIQASGGDGLVRAQDAQIELGITMPEPDPAQITSTKYVVNNTDKDISRIAPNTTVAQFKANVTANRNLTFLDKEGNTLTDASVLGTGMTVKVGNDLTYTLVVTGDVNGDAEVTIDDLAGIKLHIIDIKKLTGIQLKAGNIDNDANSEISINDVAQLKLKLIGLFEII